jgi:hypothetical protein
MSAVLVALFLQPDDPVALPPSPLSEADLLLFLVFALIVAAVFGLDMVRTWWETNEWRRDARRRKREMR